MCKAVWMRSASRSRLACIRSSLLPNTVSKYTEMAIGKPMLPISVTSPSMSCLLGRDCPALLLWRDTQDGRTFGVSLTGETGSDELQGVEKKGVQDGEDQTGQEVGHFDLLESQQVDADGNDHEAARGRQLVENVWLHQEPQGGTQQSQTALDDEHQDSTECHPAAQCRGERYADDQIEDGLRVDERAIPGHPLLNGPDNGHGPDAVNEHSSDQPLGPLAAGSHMESLLKALGSTIDQVLQPKEFSNDDTTHQSHDHDDGITRLESHAHTDGRDRQPIRDEDGVTGILLEELASQHADDAADDNCDGIGRGTQRESC